jgi:hypothetical protein
MSPLNKRRWSCILIGLFYSIVGLLVLPLASVAKRQGVVASTYKGWVMDAGQCYTVVSVAFAGALYCFYKAIRTKH